MHTQAHGHRLAPRCNVIRIMAVASSVLVGALFSATSAGAAPAVPVGFEGGWTNVFDDEFNGSSLDTNAWTTNEGGQINNVTTHDSNVSVSGGHLVLTLADSGSGATINSDAPGGHHVAVGEYVEASVEFPGNGTDIYNWPAWWLSGPNWPSAGENDIAEGLGTLTVNYHSLSGSHNQGTIPGAWSNAFHTYGVYRAANHSDVYWDGQLVKSYPTDDNAAPETMIFNVGDGNTTVYGTGSQMLVDWVRAWKPGPGATHPVAAPPGQVPWWDAFWNGVVGWFQSQVRALFGG